MGHSGKTEAKICRIPEAVAQSPRLAGTAAPHRYELCACATPLAAGTRAPIVGPLEEMAKGGNRGCDAADAGFDVGAEHGVCNPDCCVISFGNRTLGGYLVLLTL
jgi:hypothetical protein